MDVSLGERQSGIMIHTRVSLTPPEEVAVETEALPAAAPCYSSRNPCSLCTPDEDILSEALFFSAMLRDYFQNIR